MNAHTQMGLNWLCLQIEQKKCSMKILTDKIFEFALRRANKRKAIFRASFFFSKISLLVAPQQTTLFPRVC